MEKDFLKSTDFAQMYAAELNHAFNHAQQIFESMQTDLANSIQTFHRLKGVSGIIGYHDIGHAAAEVEQLLKDNCSDENKLQIALEKFISVVNLTGLLK